MTGAVQSKMESEASVGSEAKSNAESKSCASVGTEVSKRKHDMVCIEAKHDVGRWRRSAGIGKGRGDCKRDRESEGEGSNCFVDKSYEIEKIETLSNPKRSLTLACDTVVSKSVGSGGQTHDDVQQQRPNTHESPTTPITPDPTTQCRLSLICSISPRNNDDPDQHETILPREHYPF